MRDFDRIAEHILRLANHPSRDRLAVLRRECPEIIRQIKCDAGRTGPLIFWGRCQNTDEFAGKLIVEGPILEVLAAVAQIRQSSQFPNAGLQHTYGYLFSLIDTPYGKKRDRWITSTLERSFGLPHDILSPNPADGTLLANATWVAGQIAFRGSERRHWLRRCLAQRSAESVRSTDFDRLDGWRLTETVVIATARDPEVSINLITDLVRMPDSSRTDDGWLLVYSVDDQRHRWPRLVTMFTVSDEFVDTLRSRAQRSRRPDLRLRYNAHVARFPREPQSGTVKIRRR